VWTAIAAVANLLKITSAKPKNDSLNTLKIVNALNPYYFK